MTNKFQFAKISQHNVKIDYFEHCCNFLNIFQKAANIVTIILNALNNKLTFAIINLHNHSQNYHIAFLYLTMSMLPNFNKNVIIAIYATPTYEKKKSNAKDVLIIFITLHRIIHNSNTFSGTSR